MLKKILYNCIKLLPMPDYLKHILEHATSQGYRSNVLKPLYGLMIILFLAMIVSLWLKMNVVAYICLAFALFIVVAFLVCYFYCLLKNPDLLRSEKFNLEKTAMEKIAVSGDSIKKNMKSLDTDYVNFVSLGDIKENSEEK